MHDGIRAWQVQVQLESQVYESTLQKMNGQLESSLAVMAGEKAALQLSLTALQEQLEGVAQAVYSADDSVVGLHHSFETLESLPRKLPAEGFFEFFWIPACQGGLLQMCK